MKEPYFQIAKRIGRLLEDGDLPPGAFALYSYVGTAGADRPWGIATTLAALAAVLGVSEKSVSRYLRRLRDLGLVEYDLRAGQRPPFRVYVGEAMSTPPPADAPQSSSDTPTPPTAAGDEPEDFSRAVEDLHLPPKQRARWRAEYLNLETPAEFLADLERARRANGNTAAIFDAMLKSGQIGTQRGRPGVSIEDVLRGGDAAGTAEAAPEANGRTPPAPPAIEDDCMGCAARATLREYDGRLLCDDCAPEQGREEADRAAT